MGAVDLVGVDKFSHEQKNFFFFFLILIAFIASKYIT